MPTRRPRSIPYAIRRRDQLAALESAVRQEIIDTVQAAGPRSAAEISALLGRPADALYYHIRRLAQVGLLVEHARRRTERRYEVVYDLVGHPLVLEYPAGRDHGHHPLSRLVRAMLRTAERDFRAAIGADGAAADGAERNLWAGRRHAWLSRSDLARVNRLLDQLVRIMTEARNPASGQLCTLTLVLAPRRSRGGRRGTRSTSTRKRQP